MIEKLEKLLTEHGGNIEKINNTLTGRSKIKLKAKSENGAFELTSGIFEYQKNRYYTYKDHTTNSYKVELANR